MRSEEAIAKMVIQEVYYRASLIPKLTGCPPKLNTSPSSFIKIE